MVGFFQSRQRPGVVSSTHTHGPASPRVPKSGGITQPQRGACEYAIPTSSPCLTARSPPETKIKKPRGEGGGRGGEGGRGYNERNLLLGFLVSCGYREESGLVGVRLVK